jgi:hypothetical protein
MAILGFEKKQIKRNVIIGIGAAVGLYLVFRFALKDIFVKKGINLRSSRNFVGADGINEGSGSFIAKKYDPEHLNSDGTKGATWIGYDNSDIVGYWKAGQVKLGSVLSSLI